MSINDKLCSVKKKIEDLKRKHSYKKANKDRKQQVQLTTDIVDCAGDLGVCKKEYEWIIREQSSVIREGIAGGHSVEQQKNQLLDAAVGYLLVDEAIYVLKSISSYDGLTRAYDLLDAATMKITGEKSVKFPMFSSKKPKRSEYEYLNSSDMVEEKKNFVTGFLDALIECGDIEKCVKEAREKRGGMADFAAQDFSVPEPRVDLTDPEMKIDSDNLKFSQDLINSARLGTIGFKPNSDNSNKGDN